MKFSGKMSDYVLVYIDFFNVSKIIALLMTAGDAQLQILVTNVDLALERTRELSNNLLSPRT